jgi:PDZ domain-containing protein
VNRRSTATITALVLLFACGLVGAYARVPFVRYQPGPTVNVLGDQGDGKPIVEVHGHKRYDTDGQLRMTTVRTSNRDASPSLLGALYAWISPTQSLYPFDVVYPGDQTTEEDRTESQLEMVSSQDTAIAAALTELGYDLSPEVTVLRTIPGGAAEGKLKPHDVIVAVDGKPIESTRQVAKDISALEPGEEVTLDIHRQGKPMSVTLTTKAAADDPSRAVIGIYPGVGFEFPFDVSVQIPDSIGGPSAGLIFALAVYDTLTPGALTGGAEIAGTGTVDENGRVGPIGGIQQKIAGAEQDGATLFLVPPDNCASAMAADTDLRLVRADTLHSAVESIKTYAADPDAPLPTCPGAAA